MNAILVVGFNLVVGFVDVWRHVVLDVGTVGDFIILRSKINGLIIERSESCITTTGFVRGLRSAACRRTAASDFFDFSSLSEGRERTRNE